MEIVACEHPVRVYNKYIGEYIHAACGHCNACKRRRSAKWVSRLERERMCHKYCFFVTLTYDEQSIPTLVFDETHSLLVDSEHAVSIPYSELIFSSDADRRYFNDRMTLRGIPYASVADIQKFHKRLNKYFKDNVTSTYQNFRYFTVSEYGSTTLRPHFHSIYFVDEERVANNFKEAVCSCWKFGLIDCQSVVSTANSYVAQYLNELFDLPSFYQHSTLRPFHLCSKRPPIGGDLYDEEEFREIFEYTKITVPRRGFASETSLVDVPLLQCVENRIFPKCRAFGEISHSLRISVYRQSIRFFASFVDFKQFYWNVFYIVHCGTHQLGKTMLDVDRYLSQIVDGFSERGVNALKRLYYISKRVINNCIAWHCTVDYYVTKIEEYWSKKELSVLNVFYSMQEHVGDPEQLIHCYPEFVHQQLALPESPYILPLSECSSYRRFVTDSASLYQKVTKSHFKNAYFAYLRDKNNQLFKLLNNFYHAKKCHEALETFC